MSTLYEIRSGRGRTAVHHDVQFTTSEAEARSRAAAVWKKVKALAGYHLTVSRLDVVSPSEVTQETILKLIVGDTFGAEQNHAVSLTGRDLIRKSEVLLFKEAKEEVA